MTEEKSKEGSGAGLKERGNEAFKAGDLETALELYDKASGEFLREGGPGAVQGVSVVQANRAACLLKLGKHRDALDACDNSLKHNGANLKATYRRALALEGLGRHAEALEAARIVVKADPKDKASVDLARRLARHESEAALDASCRRDPLQVLDSLIASLAKEESGQENNDALKKVCSMLHSQDDREDYIRRVVNNPRGISSIVSGIHQCPNATDGDDKPKIAGLHALHAVALSSDAALVTVWEAMRDRGGVVQHAERGSPSARAAGGTLAALLCRDAKRAEAMFAEEKGIEAALAALTDATTMMDAASSPRTDAASAAAETTSELGHAGMDMVSCMLGYAGGKRTEIAWKFVRARGVEALYAYVGTRNSGTESRLTAAFKNVCDALGGEQDQEEFVNQRLLPPTKELLLRADGDALAQHKAASAIALLATAGHFMPNAVTQNTAVMGAVVSMLGEGASARGSAARAISALCANRECSERLVAAGCLPPLLDQAGCGTEDEKASAAVALAKLSVLCQEARTAVVEGGGLDLVASLASSADVGVQRVCVEALSFMCVSEGEQGEEGGAREEILRPSVLDACLSLADSTDLMVRYGLAQSIQQATLWERVDEDEEKDAVRQLQMMGENQVKPEQAAKDLAKIKEMRNKREERTDSFRKRFVAAGGTRIIAKIIAGSGATLGLHMCVAETMLALTIAKENRGRMVQDGALKCLLSVGKDLEKDAEKNHREGQLFQADAKVGGAPKEAVTLIGAKRKAAHAVARIGVTTNPNMFTTGAAKDCIKPLIDLCNVEDELAQFEASLALTNLASVGEDLKLTIYRSAGVGMMQSLCASENLLVQQAAAGCLCNMCTCDPILEEIENSTAAGKSHVRIFLVLTQQAEQPETMRYAASALANLSGFPPAAKLIAEGEGGGLAKLVGLLSSGVDSVIHPCAFALQNLIEASDDWSRALLDAGILPPLLLLNETADRKKQWGEPVRACLDALAAAMGTPKDAREAAQRTDLGAWLVVPQAS